MSEKIKVKFLLNNTPLYSKKIEPSKKLSEIRKNFEISEEYIFQTNDGYDILKDDEDDYTVEESLIDKDKIVMKTAKPQIKINEPVKGSKKVGNKNNLDLYLYPVDKLTKDEEKKAIILMVVGQPGSGKTTLLNAYINYLMGINYEDNFRYNIVYEQFNKKQDESQTSEVTVYNIKSPDGLIIQIIDTPGFGDTGGIKKDIEITQKIRQAFIDQLSSITCICFVAQSCNARLSAN